MQVLGLYHDMNLYFNAECENAQTSYYYLDQVLVKSFFYLA